MTVQCPNTLVCQIALCLCSNKM